MIRLNTADFRHGRSLVITLIVALVLSSSSLLRVQAAAGDLDPTFGTGGKVTTGPNATATGLAIQNDGKLVVVGGFAATRYNTDGSLDSSFGIGGRVTTSFFFSPTSVAIQPDGKIVIGGNSIFIRSLFALTRLNTDGSADSSFGVSGKVTTDFSPSDAGVNAIALQPDGKIVAAGFRGPVTRQNASDFALARYNAGGSLDVSFGSGGKVTTDFLGLADVANAVAIQPDGKIVAVGYNNVTAVAEFLFNFALARYNSDGSPDASFGSGGKVTTEFFGSYDEARAVIIQPGGKLVVAGTASNPFQESFSDFGLVRYNSDGGLDATFGDNGKVMTDFNSEFDDAWALTQQQDGRLVVAGQSEDSQERSDFALARYNANGELDATFGSDGRAKTDFFGFDDGVRAVALQNDGKIVAAGVANDVIEDQFQVYIAVARYDGVSFDICLQDDGNEALFQFNSMSGDYQFTNCIGVTIGGTGVISRRGSTITLQQNGPDRRVLVQIDGGVNKGTASVQLLSQRTTFTITDRNTLNNTCSCEAR